MSWSPDRDSLEGVLERFPAARVMVLGDVMLDRYYWGQVSRISPEAPVPVVDVERESSRLGGAANVAANIQSLGGTPVLIGVVGQDAGAAQLASGLAARDIQADWLVEDASRPTTQKTRVVAHNQQVVRVDQEEVRAADPAIQAALIERCRGALAATDAIVLSDYGKGVVEPPVVGALLNLAGSQRLPVCVDPKESHFDVYHPVSVLTPNLQEASRAMGAVVKDDDELEALGWALQRRLDCPALLITRGERGMSLFEAGGDHTYLPAASQEVFDVTGAGDTVVSAYALALAAGADHKVAAFLANQAAGRVIREVGTATCSVAELRTLVVGEMPVVESTERG